MLDPTNKDSTDLPLTIRAVFIIGPDKKLKLSLNCKPLDRCAVQVTVILVDQQC